MGLGGILYMSSERQAVVNQVGCGVLFIPAERHPFDGSLLAPAETRPFDGVAKGPGGDRCFCGNEGGRHGLSVTVTGADGSSFSLRPSICMCDDCASRLNPMTAEALLMTAGGTDPIGA